MSINYVLVKLGYMYNRRVHSNKEWKISVCAKLGKDQDVLSEKSEVENSDYMTLVYVNFVG